MNLDTFALVWGSALVGLAPLVCFFFQITYPKSQLIIVFITAAFFFLLSSLTASLIWYILDPLLGLSFAWSAIVPSVLLQFVFRCAFCSLYHRVEGVIESSLEKTEAAQAEATNGGNQQDADNDNDEDGVTNTNLEAAKLKLELNDVASGLAAGTGFGGMHAILLFGSLVAFETADLGVLYQPSCPYLPSLMVSALNCFFFFFLDIFWMLFTFFGMRRRLLFPRGGGRLGDMGNNHRRRFGGYFGNTRAGGNRALWTVLITHFLASGVTTLNHYQYGCIPSLCLVPVVLVATAYTFWCGVSKNYLPQAYSNERLSLPASFSYGSRAEGMMNNDEPAAETTTPVDQELDAVQRSRQE